MLEFINDYPAKDASQAPQVDSAPEVRAAILQRVALGEKGADLAKEYNIMQSTIYDWLLQERRNSERTQSKKEAKTASNIEASNIGTVNDQIDNLCKDFVQKLKQLQLRQIMTNLKSM